MIMEERTKELEPMNRKTHEVRRFWYAPLLTRPAARAAVLLALPTARFAAAAGPADSPARIAKTDHLKLTYFATPNPVHPGQNLVLVADLEMGNKMHVYAPSTGGTIPI